ncbi:MAG: AAA family ATPase [Syntrophotaleaceae bacterium]
MRIKRLELKAFGPFTDRILDFSSELPGMHVVFGPNEAGKSSSLRALQALFFGFPMRTDDNFLHSYDQLLVGGHLQGGDGRELFFYRRKRNKNSLFDSQEQPLEPAALTPFLHGIEQDLFSTLYGIDHETLVQGGQGILEQQGEVGQALFAAGTGLASLKTIVDELESEGDNLFKQRGSSQAIAVALHQYKELQAQIKQVTLSSRDWQEHRRALDEAKRMQEEINKQRANLDKKKRKLERLKQALPYLGQRRGLLEKLGELGQVVELPADFGERRRDLEQEIRDTRNCLETANSRLKDLEEKRKDISLNQGLLDYAEEIELLHQELGQYRNAKAERPGLDGRRIGCRSDAAELLKQIRPDLPIDQVETLRPSLGKRKAIQILGGKHEALLQGVRQAGRLVLTATKELKTAQEDLQKIPPVAEVGKLSQAVLRVQKACDLDGEILNRRQELESAQKECLPTLERLGLWQGSLDLVKRLPVPLPETVQWFEQELRMPADELQRLQTEHEKLEGELTKLAEQIRAIEYAAEVPTEEDLSRARRQRDHGWQLLRRQWLEGQDVAAESRAFDPDHSLPEAYEKLVGISDQTADRLYREADRVQKHAALKARGETIEQHLEELGAQKQQFDAELADATLRWQELWIPCSIQPLSPREMHAWLTSFEKLRFQVAEADKLAQDLEGRETRRRELRTSLLIELAMAGEAQDLPGEELSPVLEMAEDLVQRRQSEQTRRTSLENKIQDLQNTLDAARGEEQEAEEELRQWQVLWKEALTPLGLDRKALPAEAVDFIETLEKCFEKLKEADGFGSRIKGIDRDAAAYEGRVRGVAIEIATDLLDLDAAQIVLHLKIRLGSANKDQALVQEYSEEIAALEQDQVSARTELDNLDGQMVALRQLAGCETTEQLNEAERRSKEYLQLKEKLDEVEATLARIAEGISLCELESQAEDIDPDELPGRIEELTNEIEGNLDPEIRRLSETIGQEKNELARMDGSGQAAELAEASQQALAKIRRLTGRFIRIKLASKFLREEIERYRAENQDPVLKIASRYFSELTLGSFAGLRTDIDDHGQPILIGVRPNGNWVQVAGMSSGTRDQLYLALRLATLEWRIQSSEPMPFIVDDILINFDDQRSKATLKALSDLASQTQVILFTHHSQIAEAAQEVNVGDRIFVHEL